MLDVIKSFFIDIFQHHRTRKIGFIAGLGAGVAILIVGFFNTLFIFLCGVVGLFIGSRFDSKDDLIQKLITKLDKILPEKIQRW
ncbi:MAG: DUF2273 domain-containing protein [Selenomonadaceae bacterium]|nr:DUF2273 domain-containing protein [Selenomonadaceae bacterium]